MKLQTQRPIFTASLEKSITILLLPHAELTNTIEQELQENPLLEGEIEVSPISQEAGTNDAAFDWDQMNAIVKISSTSIPGSSMEESEFESPSVASMMTLEDHLYQQLYWEISDPQKRKIGEFIIGNLDKDGYLQLSVEEIARILKIEGASQVRVVLEDIQNFDPIGIATQNLQECLIVQLRNRQSDYVDLAIRIVAEYWDDLGHKRYALLAKKLLVTIEKIMEAVHLIISLEPKPARNYRPIEPSIFIQPDVYVLKDEEGRYLIQPNRRGIPKLKINQMYRNMLNRPNISIPERVFIQEKLNNALNFIRNIEQRGSTLVAITRFILNHQKRFFDGEESTITPMLLKDVAAHLDRCESTISRAINNKYINTPQGLFPLKFFFSHSVASQNNENVSAYTVKEEIAQLILDEDNENPLSDQDIQNHFSSKGLHLARRTITKYRQMLHIPSSHQRK